MARQQFSGMTTKQLNQMLQSPKIRRALARRAEQMEARTRAVAYSAGARTFAKGLRVETGIRPGTGAKSGLRRPYARVINDDPKGAARQDGRAKLSHRQMMRRGAL